MSEGGEEWECWEVCGWRGATPTSPKAPVDVDGVWWDGVSVQITPLTTSLLILTISSPQSLPKLKLREWCGEGAWLNRGVEGTRTCSPPSPLEALTVLKEYGM